MWSGAVVVAYYHWTMHSARVTDVLREGRP